MLPQATAPRIGDVDCSPDGNAFAPVVQSRRRLLGDGAWVLYGQLSAAVGVLIGTRLLTEFIAPRLFGEIVLLLGIGALVMGMNQVLPERGE